MFLDKKRKLTVVDIMHKGNANPIVKENDSLRGAIEEMNKNRLGVVNVVDDRGVLKGIITDGDIRRLILSTRGTLPDFFNRRCKEVMNKDPHVIKVNNSIREALELLETLNVWTAPVVKDNVCVGTIHLHRILKAIRR